jgi:hypothetical protein
LLTKGLPRLPTAMQALLLIALPLLAGCTRSPPVVVERAVSPDRRWEIALWHQKSESILDESMLLTIDRPGAGYSSDSVRAGIKRARAVVSYWTDDGTPVLNVREFGGWLHSDRNIPEFTVCGLPEDACRRELPPAVRGNSIRLETYHSGESESFAK